MSALRMDFRDRVRVRGPLERVGRHVLTSGTDGAERESTGAVDQRRVLSRAGCYDLSDRPILTEELKFLLD